MKRADFNKIITETFAKIQELSDKKGREYSGDDDALSNFKRNAAAIGLFPEQVWHVYAAKHYDSICTYIKDLGCLQKHELTEPIEGRVDDMITYLLLFKGLIKERETIQRGLEKEKQVAQIGIPTCHKIESNPNSAFMQDVMVPYDPRLRK